jgi:hypothetical protein
MLFEQIPDMLQGHNFFCLGYGFFFKRGQNLCLIQLNKQRVYNKVHGSTQKDYNNYSASIKSPKQFASASIHNLASHLILSKITKVGENFPLKILALPFCQISHTDSKAREASPFQ